MILVNTPGKACRSVHYRIQTYLVHEYTYVIHFAPKSSQFSSGWFYMYLLRTMMNTNQMFWNKQKLNSFRKYKYVWIILEKIWYTNKKNLSLELMPIHIKQQIYCTRWESWKDQVFNMIWCKGPQTWVFLDWALRWIYLVLIRLINYISEK